jgi:hypothetical protein
MNSMRRTPDDNHQPPMPPLSLGAGRASSVVHRRRRPPTMLVARNRSGLPKCRIFHLMVDLLKANWLPSADPGNGSCPAICCVTRFARFAGPQQEIAVRVVPLGDGPPEEIVIGHAASPRGVSSRLRMQAEVSQIDEIRLAEPSVEPRQDVPCLVEGREVLQNGVLGCQTLTE